MRSVIKHIRFFSILLTTLLCHFAADAQSAEDSVKEVVNGMFAAIKAADGKQFSTYFADSAILQTIVYNAQQGFKVRDEKLQDFTSFMSQLKPGDSDEQIVFETIKIDGPLALVWTPYKFYFKNVFSHCGVNSFHLIRSNSGWKIQYLIDTRRKINCEK